MSWTIVPISAAVGDSAAGCSGERRCCPAGHRAVRHRSCWRFTFCCLSRVCRSASRPVRHRPVVEPLYRCQPIMFARQWGVPSIGESGPGRSDILLIRTGSLFSFSARTDAVGDASIDVGLLSLMAFPLNVVKQRLAAASRGRVSGGVGGGNRLRGKSERRRNWIGNFVFVLGGDPVWGREGATLLSPRLRRVCDDDALACLARRIVTGRAGTAVQRPGERRRIEPAPSPCRRAPCAYLTFLRARLTQEDSDIQFATNVWGQNACDGHKCRRPHPEGLLFIKDRHCSDEVYPRETSW
jgi:hypothetical protein